MNSAQRPSPTIPLLDIKDVSVGYGSKIIVSDISISLKAGEIGCLLGPSGCGKSTLLRAIAGFEPVITGDIKLSNSIVSTNNHTQPPEKRNIGMVFQDISLFPHLNIEDNIRFGIKHLPQAEQLERVVQLLELVDLSQTQKQFPHELSGGQQQRIALARALAPKPKLILLDEPFSGLDAKLKETLVPQVRSILKAENVSALMVSHDQGEAFAICDKIAVMSKGQIHQWDTPYNTYHQPASKFAASFIGKSKFLPAITTCNTCIDTALGNLRSDAPHGYQKDSQVDVLVRIDDVQHSPEAEYFGYVTKKDFHGSYFTYDIKISNEVSVLCSTPAHYHHRHEVGDKFHLALNIEHLVLFDRI